MGTSLTHSVAIKNWEVFPAVEVCPEDQGVPAPHWVPQSGELVLGSGVPITSGFKSYVPIRWRAAGDVGTTGLKGIAHRVTCSQTN